jgi:hypothetical protein
VPGRSPQAGFPGRQVNRDTWWARSSEPEASWLRSGNRHRTGIGFVWGNASLRLKLASFGASPPDPRDDVFGTQHIITGQWVRLGSRFAGDRARFLDPSSREYHWVRFAKRSLASFGKTVAPGARTFFGTQHIITDQWVRLGKPFRGRCRPFMRPILPRLPLGSFGRAVVGFVRGNTPHLEQGHFSELNTSERVLASFGEAVSWEPSTAFSTHLPEYAIGFVAHVPSLVKSHKVST